MATVHTEHCIDMALMSIIENNETTVVLEPGRGGEGTPETRGEALVWLINGNTMCHEPEKCAELARSRIPERCEAFALKGTGYGSCDAILDKRGQCPYARSHRDSHPGRYHLNC